MVRLFGFHLTRRRFLISLMWGLIFLNLFLILCCLEDRSHGEKRVRAGIVAKVEIKPRRPKIVPRIYVQDGEKSGSSGMYSGTAWCIADGFWMTARHVTDHCNMGVSLAIPVRHFDLKARKGFGVSAKIKKIHDIYDLSIISSKDVPGYLGISSLGGWRF